MKAILNRLTQHETLKKKKLRQFYFKLQKGHTIQVKSHRFLPSL